MTEQHERARLSERLAVLEERMETMNERYDKGWALLREDMAKRDAEAARRETRLLRIAAGAGLQGRQAACPGGVLIGGRGGGSPSPGPRGGAPVRGRRACEPEGPAPRRGGFRKGGRASPPAFASPIGRAPRGHIE